MVLQYMIGSSPFTLQAELDAAGEYFRVFGGTSVSGRRLGTIRLLSDHETECILERNADRASFPPLVERLRESERVPSAPGAGGRGSE